MGRMAKPKDSSSSGYGKHFTSIGMQNICGNSGLALQWDVSKGEEERNISKIGTWTLKPCYHKRDSVRVSWGLEISRCFCSLALMHHDPAYPALQNDSILNPIRLSVGCFGLKQMDRRSLFSPPSLVHLVNSHFFLKYHFKLHLLRKAFPDFLSWPCSCPMVPLIHSIPYWFLIYILA